MLERSLVGESTRRLAAGLAILVLAAALSPFVVWGLAGLLLLPVAFALLVTAGAPGRPPFALIWSVIGAGLLVYGAYRAGALACAQALHRLHAGAPAVTAGAWLAAFLLELCGSVLLTGVLAHGAGWPRPLRRYWFLAAAAVFPLTVMLFWGLARWLPFTA